MWRIRGGKSCRYRNRRRLGEVRASAVRRAVTGEAVGNLIERFDYASYGYLAATIAVVFFAPGNETVALLGAFGVFAVSFVVRPVGGLFWGHFGDRLGRKRTLELTIIILSAASHRTNEQRLRARLLPDGGGRSRAPRVAQDVGDGVAAVAAAAGAGQHRRRP